MEQPTINRLLHRNSAHGYTLSPSTAMRGEPQALDADAQAAITKAAGDRELRAWTTSRQRLLSEIDHLRTHIHSPHVTKTTRALQREIEALDRKLA